MSDLAATTLPEPVTEATDTAAAASAEVAGTATAPVAAPAAPAPAAPEPAPPAAPEPDVSVSAPPVPEPETPAPPPPPAPEPAPEAEAPQAPAQVADAPDEPAPAIEPPAQVADVPDEPAPAIEPPAVGDGDALATVPLDSGTPPADDPVPVTADPSTVLDGGAAQSLEGTVDSVVGDTPIGQVPDGVSTGPLPDEVTTTATNGDAVATVADDPSIGPLPDIGTATAGDESPIAAITGDLPIAPRPDTGTATAGDDSPIAAITGDLPIAPLTDVGTAVTDNTPLAALGDTLQDTTSSGLTALGSLTHSVGGVADAAGLDVGTGGVVEAGSALVTTVESSVVPQIGESAAELVSPLTTSVYAVDATLNDTGAAVTAPFAVTVPSSEAQPSPVVTGAGASTGPGGDTSTDGTAASGTHTLVDGAAVSAAPVTTAPGADPLVSPEPLLGPLLPGATDPLSRLDPAGPAALDPAGPTTLSGPAAEQSGSIVDATGLVAGPATPAPAVITDAGTADPLSPADSALAAIAEAAPDVRVLVSAAVLAMAAAAMVGPRAGGSGTDVSMVFTNVRLLPCVVKESLARHVEMLSAAITADGGSGAAAAVRAADMASSSGTRGASAEGTANPAGRARDALAHALESFRDGFEQAVADEREDIGEGLRDSRLMLQIGMLLGFVYVGFLSVWFWATRLRGTDRPGAM